MSRNGVIESLGEGLSPDNADEILILPVMSLFPAWSTPTIIFPESDPCVTRGTGCNIVQLAEDALSRLVTFRAGSDISRSLLGLAELALSGCTTSSDHQYIFPGGARLDDSIEAAQAVGVRFTATRGAMSIGESDGGLPPDYLTEKESDIVRDFERVVDRWHDSSRYAMTHVALAPAHRFRSQRG